MAYKNKEDSREYQKKWYKNNKKKRIKQIRDYQDREHEKFIEYKSGLKCSLCGYNKCISALDFHHKNKDTKDFSISAMRKRSMKRIMEEIKKCILVCKNCHAEIHEKEILDC